MTAGAAPARAARRGWPAAWPAPEGQGACLGGQTAGDRATDGGSTSVRGDSPPVEGGATEGGIP